MNGTIISRMTSIIEILEEAIIEMRDLLEDENIDEELYNYLDNCETHVEGVTADLVEVSMTHHVPK